MKKIILSMAIGLLSIGSVFADSVQLITEDMTTNYDIEYVDPPTLIGSICAVPPNGQNPCAPNIPSLIEFNIDAPAFLAHNHYTGDDTYLATSARSGIPECDYFLIIDAYSKLWVQSNDPRNCVVIAGKK